MCRPNTVASNGGHFGSNVRVSDAWWEAFTCKTYLLHTRFLKNEEPTEELHLLCGISRLAACGEYREKRTNLGRGAEPHSP